MKAPIVRLFTAHADAWGLTALIVGVALTLHDGWTARGMSLLVAIVVCYWLGFALNDYFDAADDARDPRKAIRNFFVTTRWSKRTLRSAFIVLLAGAFMILASFGLPGTIVFAIGAAVMWAYSAPPLRLKVRPGWDVIVHMSFVETFPYWITVVLIGGSFGAVDTFNLACLALASLGAQIEQQIRDYDLDRTSGQTFTIVIGVQRAAVLLKIVTGLLIALAAIGVLSGILPAFLAPFGVVALPLLLHRFLRPVHAPRSERLVRWSLLAAVGCACGLLWLQ